VTVSKEAATQEADSSVAGLKEGDNIAVKDLLYGLILPSGNDAAEALAEFHSGSIEAFAEVMNETALELGATGSHFTNPSGLPDTNHYTTVYDMYLIFKTAIENPKFVEIINTKSKSVTYTAASGKTIQKTYNNTNRYFTGYATIPDGFTLIGGKTGTTGAAKYCLVLYTQNEAGEDIISIVFKADCRHNLYWLMNQILRGFAK
jgi:D-alanyl-D-alanine carboxypeptidase (penicillin-binding protein 5/6)